MKRDRAAILERFEPVIGLEVHVQLATESKIFCACSAAFGAPPNTHTCPVCLGLPGALPVLNEAVVEAAVVLALALGAEVRPHSRFDRKHYFYADLPKGYQITQQAEPIARGGRLRYLLPGGEVREARLMRIHMEEDAGKSVHDAGDGRSRLDFNRAGVPLLEIVSEPDLPGPEAAAACLKALRGVVRALRISDGNLEAGSLRCDANVSLRRRGERRLGVRCEVKNLNSFRFVARALEHEILRQGEILLAGGEVVRETRLYDPATGATRPLRAKEDLLDYRALPEPDLPPVVVGETLLARARARLRELPVDRALRLAEVDGLALEQARILAFDEALFTFYERARAAYAGAPSDLASWLTGEVAHEAQRCGGIEGLALTPEALAKLVTLIREGTLSRTAAKEVLAALAREGGTPAEIARRRGLVQVSDPSVLEPLVRAALGAHPKEVAAYRAGKRGLLGFFVGQVMKASGGRADPRLASDLLRRALEGDDA